jgi:hypothetical protein
MHKTISFAIFGKELHTHTHTHTQNVINILLMYIIFGMYNEDPILVFTLGIMKHID